MMLADIWSEPNSQVRLIKAKRITSTLQAFDVTDLSFDKWHVIAVNRPGVGYWAYNGSFGNDPIFREMRDKKRIITVIRRDDAGKQELLAKLSTEPYKPAKSGT